MLLQERKKLMKRRTKKHETEKKRKEKRRKQNERTSTHPPPSHPTVPRLARAPAAKDGAGIPITAKPASAPNPVWEFTPPHINDAQSSPPSAPRLLRRSSLQSSRAQTRQFQFCPQDDVASSLPSDATAPLPSIHVANASETRVSPSDPICQTATP
jgi:hypothetical protein